MRLILAWQTNCDGKSSLSSILPYLAMMPHLLENRYRNAQNRMTSMIGVGFLTYTAFPRNHNIGNN